MNVTIHKINTKTARTMCGIVLNDIKKGDLFSSKWLEVNCLDCCKNKLVSILYTKHKKNKISYTNELKILKQKKRQQRMEIKQKVIKAQKQPEKEIDKFDAEKFKRYIEDKNKHTEDKNKHTEDKNKISKKSIACKDCKYINLFNNKFFCNITGNTIIDINKINNKCEKNIFVSNIINKF